MGLFSAGARKKALENLCEELKTKYMVWLDYFQEAFEEQKKDEFQLAANRWLLSVFKLHPSGDPIWKKDTEELQQALDTKAPLDNAALEEKLRELYELVIASVGKKEQPKEAEAQMLIDIYRSKINFWKY